MALVELYRDDLVFTAYMTGVTAATAGNLLAVINQNDVVTSSGKSSLADSDIWVQNLDTLLEDRCVRIALEAADTTGYTAVATRGLYILRAGGVSTAGIRIVPMGGTDSAEVRTYNTSGSSSWWIGKALSGASAADAYIICILDIA